MKIVIPSKGRANVIGDKALRLFPDALLCVGDDEADAYGRLSSNLLVHPANVVGIGPLRQWVLDHVEDPCVVMVDDDVTHVYDQSGFHKRRIEDPDTVRAIVERTEVEGPSRPRCGQGNDEAGCEGGAMTLSSVAC